MLERGEEMVVVGMMTVMKTERRGGSQRKNEEDLRPKPKVGKWVEVDGPKLTLSPLE